MLPLLVGGQNAQNSRLSGTGQLILRVLANDTVTPAVVLIGGATITPQWYWSDGTSFSGLDGFGGAGKVVTTGMTVTLDTQGHPEEIQQIVLTGDPFGFDLSALASFTGLTVLAASAEANAVYTGGLSDLPASVTNLNLNTTGSTITGTLADLPAGAVNIKLYTTSSVITGSLADLPTTMTTLFLQATASSITGSIAGLPAGMTDLRLYSTTSTITGSLSDLPVGMIVFLVFSTTSTVTGGGTPVPALGLNDVSLLSTTMTEAQVDSICLRIYTDRAIFTDASPALNIGGTNPNPSGVYQDDATPSTGLEYVYKIVVDPDAEGFNAWTVTY